LTDIVPIPGPGAPTPPLSSEDAYLELLIETLAGLDLPARGQFVQRYLRAIAQLEVSEQEALEYWERILARRAEFSSILGKPLSLKTALVDVLATSRHLRVPILMEYEELKKLQFNAATDPLTGLYNRRLFDDSFDKELNRARRYDHKLVLVILDLHQFKAVNDLHGHLRGDNVLQTAANTLRKSLRTSDYAFRIGGDEFALLLPEADAEQATTLSRRVRANFAAEFADMRLGMPVDLDYGIAVYPEDGDLKETLIRVADERLYRLKLSGSAVAPEERRPESSIGETVQRLREEAQRREASAPGALPKREPDKHAADASSNRRRWERVSLAGTNATAAIGEGAKKSARIVDLGYGGVALESSAPDELTAVLSAVLNVPILPPVRVSLKRVYVHHAPDGKNRIGCAFIT
jgi:diguanylate cyclase (GGDEF)-like protein